MTILLMFFTFSLLGGLLTRRIPKYYQCLEKCGRDPLDDPEESRKFDACRDKCIEVALNICVDQATDEATGRKCVKKAEERCIANCVEDGDCIRLCKAIYSQETV
ncbi:hypothetical protein CRM22_004881 [Opisthorchis felineus]|uniref:Uncharacterized protein n=1 Tax=Opisthorchis felineus TaxID=147828 RepID=A0A4S2LZK5_OPIFE|nr:hypothetical protein CRM22_004881 [Opisthorchis felineus]